VPSMKEMSSKVDGRSWMLHKDVQSKQGGDDTGPQDGSHCQDKLGVTRPHTSAIGVSISDMSEAQWAEMSSFVG
jgi:hypothetical protein